MFYYENIFWRLARGACTENHKYFLYFHLIILTCKIYFLFTTENYPLWLTRDPAGPPYTLLGLHQDQPETLVGPIQDLTGTFS